MVASGEKSPNCEFGDSISREVKFRVSSHLTYSFYLSQLGSGQQAVKESLGKGLGLNPNAVPSVALHCITNQDIASGRFKQTSSEG